MRAIEITRQAALEESHWWFMSRRALLCWGLGKDNPPGALRILDIGAATGGNRSMCENFGEYVALDLSEAAVECCRSRGLRKLVQGDARQLPFSEASFDVVVALDILEHLPEDEISIAEIARVLRPKGRLIVNVPAFQRLFSSHDVSFDHIRRYEPKELPRKLRHAGFSLDHWTYWSFFIFPAVFVLRTLTWTEPRNDTVRNDFDLWLPPGTETVMRFFAGLELFLIHLGIRLPFGVSYFCVSNKLEA
jgi:SAM-dependent methyltransferase